MELRPCRICGCPNELEGWHADNCAIGKARAVSMDKRAVMKLAAKIRRSSTSGTIESIDRWPCVRGPRIWFWTIKMRWPDGSGSVIKNPSDWSVSCGLGPLA